MAGPLAGLRVIELAHEFCAFAGKLLADAGADVIVVEPPQGAAQRGHGPFVGDQPSPERSLSWWHYNTSKRGVTLDLEHEPERLRELLADADIFLEGELPGRLGELGLDYPDIKAALPALIMVSITAFGREAPESALGETDLTLAARSGMTWMCGYDDHTVPPVRGGGNQAIQTGAHYAVMSLLAAVLHRDQSGLGQHVDVSINASCNVTTESGSYAWLVSGATVYRQTGRHAAARPTSRTQVRCVDGRYVNTGVPPRTPVEFGRLGAWVRELGLDEEFPEVFLLDMALERDQIDLGKIGEDEEITAIYGAGRDALVLIASRLDAYRFFREGQDRGFTVGIIYSPEELLEDPHFKARGFPVEIYHPELEETVIYPGVPWLFHGSPCRIRCPAPGLGEHNDEVFGTGGTGQA